MTREVHGINSVNAKLRLTGWRAVKQYNLKILKGFCHFMISQPEPGKRNFTKVLQYGLTAKFLRIILF